MTVFFNLLQTSLLAIKRSSSLSMEILIIKLILGDLYRSKYRDLNYKSIYASSQTVALNGCRLCCRAKWTKGVESTNINDHCVQAYCRQSSLDLL